MFQEKENIRILKSDTFIVICIIILGLLIRDGSMRPKAEERHAPVTGFNSSTEKSGIMNPCIRIQYFQKEWIVNRDNFNPLAFSRNKFIDDKKTDLIVFNFMTIRQNLNKTPIFIYLHHLSPKDFEEPPLAG